MPQRLQSPTPEPRALLGIGTLRHERLRPKPHAFAYPTFFLMLPLRALRERAEPALARNRFAWAGFHDHDHGDGRADCLAWFDELLTREGIADADGEVWKPESVCYYFINDSAPPSFVVDVSEHYDTKRRALACFVSQLRPTQADAVATRLTSAGFTQLIESRDAQFGALAGVAFAEGIVVKHPVLRPHLLPE